MQMRKLSKALIIIFFIGVTSNAQIVEPPFLRYMNHPWVDSVMNTLNQEQQIAQCIWIAGYSNRDVSHEVEVSDIIRKYNIGGIIFFQGTAAKQAELTNYYQTISKVPLIIAMDAEWGVGMRLENIEKFPYQMTLGAIKNDSLIFQFGKMVANQFNRLGMHINLAPVADININPLNPVINYRSFGENREKVAIKTTMYMKGLQDKNVLATGKHFPGHGDTNIDSHLDLPVLSQSRQRLDTIELYPFRELINEGIGSIMTAHLNLPSLDSTPGLPSSLSSPVITEILKKELGFRGLIISDAMNMKGVTRNYKPGEADAKALCAGNDVIEFVTDIDAALKEIKNYILLKKLTNEEISLKCRKILALKYWAGLNNLQTIKKQNIDTELSPMNSIALIRDLYANALTVLNNNQNIIPVKNLNNIKIATLAVNKSTITSYQQTISKYIPADHFYLNPSDSKACEDILIELSSYDLVIAGIFGLDQRPDKGFGIKPELNSFIEKLNNNNKSIITWFGNPYGLDKTKSLQNTDGLIIAYQENEHTEDLSAQLIFGGIGAKGSLPVTINKNWKADFGIVTPGNLRLQYGLPESVDMSSDMLNSKIDSIVDIGLKAKAFPGCEVMAARKGVVIYQKSFGYHTYDNRTLINENDLFDLASLTKVTAAVPALMLLDSDGKFNPDQPLGTYLNYFKHSDKNNILIRDLLAHQAGMTSWIPYWKETVKKNGKFKRNIFETEYDEKHPLEVARGLYINKNYRKKIFSEIKKSQLGEKKLIYSDLGFIIFPDLIENIIQEPWNEFITRTVYQKIGAHDILFNPGHIYPLSRIVPTEYDSLFRKQLLHGTVHDEAAAMLGGISGHAGLFSTANDLMKLLELYRRMGEYGGEQIIGKDVMEEYTRVQFPENNNRRGLGFDKPLLNNSELTHKEAYPATSASPSSFGHSGFTGTFFWIDPACDITVIFLSNRVHPTRDNNLISELNIRSGVLQAVYDSINK